jgi:hypothetical protein
MTLPVLVDIPLYMEFLALTAVQFEQLHTKKKKGRMFDSVSLDANPAPQRFIGAITQRHTLATA